MRYVPSSIAAQFASDHGKLSRGVALLLRDGTLLGFTDHDVDTDIYIEGDLVTLRADLGVASSDLSLQVGLDSSTVEITRPIGSTATRTDVKGRRFNQATVWVFDHDWSAMVPDPMPLMKGRVSDAWVRNQMIVLECRSLGDRFNEVIGSLLAPRCRATFADAQCGKTKIEVPAVVTSVINSMEFTTDLAGTLSDGYFRFGECRFTTGNLSNVWALEVYDYFDATGNVEVLEPFPQAPEIGDQLLLSQGCSNLKASDIVGMPTCLSYANVVNFRGFDQVPGSDIYLRVPIPGEG